VCPAPAATGDRTVRARVRDKDGGETAYAAILKVQAPEPVVELCSDSFYRGYCPVVSGDLASLAGLGLNDLASSIRITGTVAVSLYQQADFAGSCETFTAGDAWLGDNPIGNDTVSSLKVGTACPGDAAPPAPTASPSATPTSAFPRVPVKGEPKTGASSTPTATATTTAPSVATATVAATVPAATPTATATPAATVPAATPTAAVAR
jgi:hypothetical protein